MSWPRKLCRTPAGVARWWLFRLLAVCLDLCLCNQAAKQIPIVSNWMAQKASSAKASEAQVVQTSARADPSKSSSSLALPSIFPSNCSARFRSYLFESARPVAFVVVVVVVCEDERRSSRRDLGALGIRKTSVGRALGVSICRKLQLRAPLLSPRWPRSFNVRPSQIR